METDADAFREVSRLKLNMPSDESKRILLGIVGSLAFTA
jgi:hypothetical protein